MDKFPTEILNNIFNHLHQTEKVESMLVCRHWAQSIRMSCLLNTVTIVSLNYDSDATIGRFDSLARSLQQIPILRNQVQHLFLKDCFDFNFDGSILGTQFPHLRFLFLSNTYIGQDRFTETQLERFKSWEDYLEVVVENETALFTLSFIETGVFNCLTTICLKPDRESVPAPIEERHFKSLRNVPNLITLKLEGLSFPLEYIELIHENTPKLEHLSLGCIFLDDEARLPETTSPTSYMKTLCIYDCTLPLSMQYTWINYISQKYSSLTEFTFECDIDPIDLDLGINGNDYMALYLLPNLGQQLELLHLESNCLLPELFDAIDANGYKLQDMKLNRVESPSFLTKFFHSNQAQYIQSLTLIHLTDFYDFHLLENFTVLKTLNLDFGSKYNNLVYYLDQPSLVLNRLIKQCSTTLENLTISNTLIEIDSDLTPQSTQLKTLKFINVKIESAATNFISANCPQLSSISLIKCATPVLEFKLPIHNLMHFEIVGHYPTSTFILTKSNETLYYNVSDQEDPIKPCCESLITKDIRPFYNVCKPVSFQQVNVKLKIRLVCRSVRTVFINGQLAL